MLKWPEGTAIKVAYAYLHTPGDLKRKAKPRRWRVGRWPTGAHVRALVGRLREATGLALELVEGRHLKPDNTINILALDDFTLQEWDPSGLDQDKYQKYQFIRAGRFIDEKNRFTGRGNCSARLFFDESQRLKYAHLVVSFDRYTDADVSRCLTEAAAWTLGVPLWAPEDDKSNKIGPFTLIELLYDPRIEPGMTEDQVFPIVRDRLCAQR